MASKKLAAPKPSRTEENLPLYDKDELQKERDLIAKAEACAISAKLAKSELGKLTKQKAGLSKKDPNSGAMALEIHEKIKALQGVALLSCHLYHPGCVPSVDSKKIMSPKSLGEDLNKVYGTKIDFERLSIFEGGEHTVAYIPWWPYLKKDRATILFYKNTLAKDTPRLAGYYNGKPQNKSGATIGIGVDLGQASADRFLEKMKMGNSGVHKFSEMELIKLHEKISPYFQKFGGEACKFLRENPLILEAKESHFLNKVAHEDALKTTIKTYTAMAARRGSAKKFLDLTIEQQTALLSNGYQKGAPDEALMIAIINQKGQDIPVNIREHKYLFESMKRKEKK